MRRHQPLVAMNTGRTLFGFIAVLAVSTAVVSAKTTPVKIEQTVEGRFPASLEFTPITSGQARVMINVDSEGKLADLMVVSYSNPAFAEEAAALLKRWRYSPATVDGEPVGVRFQLEIDFVAKGRVISLTAIETTNSLVDKIIPVQLVKRVCAAGELDHPLEVLQAVNPPNPGLANNASQSSGSTLVDFYVDENGQARMPVVMETTNPSFAQAAVNALNQWKFSSPTRRGKPIAVRVQQEFIFPGSS
jgi:TonB family protein